MHDAQTQSRRQRESSGDIVPREEFVLTLRPEPGWSSEPIQRLRALLKRLKRSHGFTCTGARAVDGSAVSE